MDAFHSVVSWAPTPAHAFYAARVGRRVGGLACLHPGVGAVVCWAVWAFLSSPIVIAAASAPASGTLQVGSTWNGATQSYSDPVTLAREVTLAGESAMSRPAGTLAYVTGGIKLVGLTLATTAILLAVINLFSAPTHARTHDGRLRPIRGAGRPSMAERHRARPGAFARVKGGRGGALKDWHAAKGDAEKMRRGLARYGKWRLTRWGRRWSYEAANGAEPSQPRFYDRWAFRRVDAPAGKVGGAVTKVRDRFGASKAERKAGPGDYPPDAEARLDPADGPPLSPPQREAWADRMEDIATAVRNDAADARERIWADVLAMQSPQTESEPVSTGNGSEP